MGTKFISMTTQIFKFLQLIERLKNGEQVEFETLPKKCYPISYNAILRYDHSYEPGSVVSSANQFALRSFF